MESFLLEIAQASSISAFMHSAWGWPLVESLHFTGMCLLVGTVGLFDLRLLGLAPSVPLNALHRLVPFGIVGYLLNVISGALFVVSAPDQYLYNPAFQTKIAFMAIAGLNMLLFYRLAVPGLRLPSENLTPPYRARLMGGVSLACWAMVIVCGRLITYYRPPYHWCFWC
jgi:uncharacterized membrane protein